MVHDCVANMPGAVPYTSTRALTKVTLTYILKLANLGWEKACESDKTLEKGLNTIVYYFHGNQRCKTCKIIEAYTREAVSKFDTKRFRF